MLPFCGVPEVAAGVGLFQIGAVAAGIVIHALAQNDFARLVVTGARVKDMTIAESARLVAGRGFQHKVDVFAQFSDDQFALVEAGLRAAVVFQVAVDQPPGTGQIGHAGLSRFSHRVGGGGIGRILNAGLYRCADRGGWGRPNHGQAGQQRHNNEEQGLVDEYATDGLTQSFGKAAVDVFGPLGFDLGFDLGLGV